MTHASADEVKGRAPQPVGHIEPREQRQQQREDVNDQRLVKRLEVVVEKFLAGLVDLRRETVGEPQVIRGDSLVEIGGRVGAVAGDHRGVGLRGRGDCAGVRGGHEIGADVLPVVARHGGIRRRNHRRQRETRDRFVIAHEADEIVEGVLIEFFAGVAGVHGGDARRDALLVGGQFRREVVRAGRLEADFEPLVKIHLAEKFHQLRLEDGAVSGRGNIRFFTLLDAVGLFLDFIRLRLELVEGIKFLVFRQLEQVEHLAVVYAENFPVVGLLGFHQHFKQPFAGGHGLAVVQRDGLLGADLEERIAGDGIERLEPAVHQHGQFSEFAGLKTVLRRLVKAGHSPARQHGGQNEGNPFFHDFFFSFLDDAGIPPARVATEPHRLPPGRRRSQEQPSSVSKRESGATGIATADRCPPSRTRNTA